MTSLIFGAICCLSQASADSSEPGQVSFEKDLMPTLKRRCAACHITGSEPGKMALVPGKAYDYLVNSLSDASPLLRVKPGHSSESYLIHKLEGTHLDVGGSGVRMPFHQAPLPPALISRFKTWINQGAAKN